MPQVETLQKLCARLEGEIEQAWRRTTDNGMMTIHAGVLQRLFAVFRAYGGRTDWRADEQSIAMLAAPVRRYIDDLWSQIVQLQKANAAHRAVAEPLPAQFEALVDPIAHILDYAAFMVGSHNDTVARRTDRRRARDKARAVLEMLQRRGCLVDVEGVAEPREVR